MSRPGEISLKEALDRLINAYKLKPKLNEAKLTERWEDIVGIMVARHTRNLYIKNNKLYIKLDSSVIRQEMMYSKTIILEKVNTELGGRYVDEIVFV